MNYSFYLFTKLLDHLHTTNLPYDELFEESREMYKDWAIWDIDNGKNIGEYESMEKYLTTHVPNFNQ